MMKIFVTVIIFSVYNLTEQSDYLTLSTLNNMLNYTSSSSLLFVIIFVATLMHYSSSCNFAKI